MKKLTTLLCVLSLFYGFSQNAPINFETGGNGADWTWTVFENDSNPALEIIANPDPTGANTSETVAQFTALQTGQPFAGVESAQGADLGEFVLDATNNIITIKVWKPVISDVGIKLVSSTFWSEGELKVPNTVVNQWEELTFDFSAYINPPAGNGVLSQIVIFPDFDARTQDNIIYFDDIRFTDGTLSTETNEFSNNFAAYPNPTSDKWIISDKTNAGFTAQIYDVKGQLLANLNNNAQQNLSIDASSFQAGIYFAKITSGNASTTIKLVKR
ncbi:MAG: T9SS type A sorting domain-containing protein [Flavobacteriaceae bacterium]|nr:T9SS type A sorting domain-containing protein [Flavobacteriaceae bacterium]